MEAFVTIYVVHEARLSIEGIIPRMEQALGCEVSLGDGNYINIHTRRDRTIAAGRRFIEENFGEGSVTEVCY